MGLTVSDWGDFQPGRLVWDAIAHAECYTHAGIFLFMKDDVITASHGTSEVPRDNVVYEAGYFAGAKDRRHALIIREKGLKMPSDFGGILCLELENRSELSSIKEKLKKEVAAMLDEPIKGKPTSL